MIDEREKSPDEKREKEEKNAKAREGAATVRVMGFELHLKGEGVVLGGREKEVEEGGLVGKFGGREGYERVKGVMQESLERWRGEEGELSGRAFGMYEKFRPSVPRGKRGWGRKGELNLAELESVIKGG